MTTDFLGWIYKYRAGSYADVWDCFGYHGLHQFFHFINYSFYRIFGLNFWAWCLFFALLHGINASLVYILFQKILNSFELKKVKSIALISAILFLISPYQVEVLTWKACMHYLLSTCMALISFLLVIKYTQSAKTKYQWTYFLVLIGALFTLELSLVIPVIIGWYLLCLQSFRSEWRMFYSQFLKILLPSIIILGTYLALNQMVLGELVGHYGSEKHLDFSPGLILPNTLKYFFKYGLFSHYLPFIQKQAIYSFSEGVGIYLIFTVLLIGALVWPFTKRKPSPRLSVIGFTLGGFCIALLPVLNLYFYKDMICENDRYGYFASPYIYLFITLLIFLVKGKLRKYIFGLYLLLISLILAQMIASAYWAGRIQHSLAEDFRWYDAEEVVLLASPDNYRGMYMYRDYDGKAPALKETLDLFQGKVFQGKFSNIMQFNMMQPDDKMPAVVLDSTKIKVMIGQGGTWFWREGIGGGDYETEDYHIDKITYEYILRIKGKKSGRIFLTQEGDKWKEIKI
jgi:hypothetical protein